jgi:hypothetical protein
MSVLLGSAGCVAYGCIIAALKKRELRYPDQMEGEETYSPAEAFKVLGRSGRKITERRIRQMLQAGELEGDRDEGGRWRWWRWWSSRGVTTWRCPGGGRDAPTL